MIVSGWLDLDWILIRLLLHYLQILTRDNREQRERYCWVFY